jgi:hypothetical protein
VYSCSACRLVTRELPGDHRGNHPEGVRPCGSITNLPLSRFSEHAAAVAAFAPLLPQVRERGFATAVNKLEDNVLAFADISIKNHRVIKNHGVSPVTAVDRGFVADPVHPRAPNPPPGPKSPPKNSGDQQDV